MQRSRQCRGTSGALWGFSERCLQLEFAAGRLLSCRDCDMVCLLLPQMSLWSTMNSLQCLAKTHQPVNLEVAVCSSAAVELRWRQNKVELKDTWEAEELKTINTDNYFCRYARISWQVKPLNWKVLSVRCSQIIIEIQGVGGYIEEQEYWLLGSQQGAIGACPAHSCNPPPAIAISPNCCLLDCKVLHVPFN